MGGYLGSTSITTFVIEQTTNSVLLAGTTTASDLSQNIGSTAFAAYIDQYAREQWFIGYPSYESIASCDIDISTSPNKMWCIFLTSSNNIIVGNI